MTLEVGEGTGPQAQGPCNAMGRVMLRIPPSPQPALTGTETKPCAPTLYSHSSVSLGSSHPVPPEPAGAVGALAGMRLSSVRDGDAAARPGTAVGMGREVSAVVPACTEQAGEGSSPPLGCQDSPFRACLERQKQ